MFEIVEASLANFVFGKAVHFRLCDYSLRQIDKPRPSRASVNFPNFRVITRLVSVRIVIEGNTVSIVENGNSSLLFLTNE